MNGLLLTLGGVGMVAAAWAASHHGTRPHPFRDGHKAGPVDPWGQL